MTQQIINLSTDHTSGTGDTVKSSFVKINENFAEIFSLFPNGFNGNVAQQTIKLNTTLSSRDGDTVRVAFTKINDNFVNLWTAFSSIDGQTVSGNTLSATQQVINLGSGPNTNTGDTVQVALDKVNKNFSNLYSLTGLGITTPTVNFGYYSPRRISTVVPTSTTPMLMSVSISSVTPGTEFQPIDLGNGPDTQTGDTVYEAFVKINENFAQLYQVLGPTGFDIVADAITSNNIVNDANIRTGNLFAYGNVSTNGNVVAGAFFYPNGASVFSNISANVNFANISSNIVPGANNVYSLGNVTNQWSGLYVSSNIVLSGVELTTFNNQLYVNGNLVTGNYGNSNVISLLSNIGSNSIVTTGNITSSYFVGNGSTLTSLTGANVTGTVANASYALQSGQSNYANTATYVTGLTGTNVNVALGYVPLNSNATALTAQYVTANAQANITSVGNLTSLIVNGTTTSYGGIQNTVIGNTTAAAGYFTTLNSTSAASLQSLTVNASSTFNSNLTVIGNLVVSGNVITTGSNNTYFTDSILELHTLPNLANLTFDDGKDIGLRFHYYKTNNQNAFLGWDNTTGYLEWFSSNVDESASSNIAGTYGTIRSGALLLVNTTPTTGSSTGALQVSGGISTGGNIYIAGNISANNFVGNSITLGANAVGQLVSNAVTLLTTTSVTDSIAQLNYVLGKLVPSAPSTFPGGQTLSVSTLSTYRMANFVQTDNTPGANKSVAGGTTISNVRRVTTYTTSTIANVGPGDTGIVTSYRNGVGVGNVTLIAGNVSGTYGNLVITRSGDYANVSNITPGFWYSFSSSLSGNVPAGWNEVYINHSAAGSTNTPYWYYDASAPGTPTFTNLAISLTTNSSTYSSTIPHLNSSSQFTMTGNVNRLSGDMYPTSDSFITGTAGGALATPSSVTYAGAGVTTPLAQNLYVSSGSQYYSTTAAVTTGFGSSSTGPTLSCSNSYNTGTGTYTSALGVTVLYKTGTSTQIEETSITVTSVGTGSGNALRVINPGSTDTPAITGNTAFNSQTSTLQTYDATVVAAILKHDQTNYSTGYLPVGPNLSSGRSGAQYFTFKFTRTVVSKFNVSVTGNVGNIWVALPGSTIDSASTLNGWIDLGTAYAGSGIPGANVSAGGNGSNGCALGGVFASNSSGTQSKTCTFGTVSSSSTVSNEIFVRLKLYAGQTVTALSIVTATN